ncbi:MAG TPA: hypothetical protein VFU21_01730 [Kofleriaceae bacterium]|nr:hypothetical protein [Kofleriaceae bacterium]
MLAIALGCGGALDRETDSEGGDETGDGSGDGTGDGDGSGGGGVAERCNRMDLIFVIDDSGSMKEEQANLAANFPDFISVIDGYVTDSGEPLDYRIAITTSGRDVRYQIDPPEVCLPVLGCEDPDPFPPTTDSGDDGAFKQKCDMSRRWIERADPDVSGTFSCAARVGTGGPSIEMPLYATELALSERVSDGTNAGFLREDALLGLVILSDEDDCSRTDNNFTVESDQCHPEWPENVAIDHFTSFLDTVKGERGRWATAVIAGPNNCSSQFGDAVNARRLKQFVSETGTNGVFSSICQGDLSSALADALETFDAACEAFPPVD